MEADQRSNIICRSLFSMRLALRCFFGAELLLGISLIGTLATLGYGLVLFLPLVAISGLLILVSGMLFWLGLVQSWQSSEDAFDRTLLLVAVIAVPLPWIVLATLSAAGFAPNADAKLVWITVPMFPFGAIMAWLLFAYRQSTKIGDSPSQAFGVLLILTPLLTLLALLAGTSHWWLESVVNRLQLPDRLGDVVITVVYSAGFLATLGVYPLTILGMTAISEWRSHLAD